MSGELHPYHAEITHPDGSWRFTNRLIRETSPYLLQHAHNPVDWYPWGPEAFDRSRKTGKPIFLSIGYSTCYWCHVMERQVFECPDIAGIMNELFVNVKVDREERPDVDDIYMTAVQMMTGRGGWPMSVFLTSPGADGQSDPGLRPFYAGTYIPPVPAHGLPGFPQLIQALSQAYTERHAEVLEESRRIAQAISSQVSRATARPVQLGAYLVRDAANSLLRTYDTEHGGFGGAPKFPQASNLLLLLHVQANNPNQQLWEALVHTLDRMARGGMYDQIGGGFHRYSTDEKWLVPHFEKMLYDNGQLLEVYARAHQLAPEISRDLHWPELLRQTADYVLREMVDESGAFWSAQDAEVDALEGGNYVWTPGEISEAIGDAHLAELASELYGLSLGTNFKDPHAPHAQPVNVLYQPDRLSDVASQRKLTIDRLMQQKEQIDRRLLEARSKRKQPGTDDKVLTSWNGMMIAGLSRAAMALNEPPMQQAASRAASAVLAKMSSEEGGLLRTMRKGQARIPAFLEDYAFLVHGLIELHRVTKQRDWLDHAIRLTNHAIGLFEAENGGYHDTLANQSDLFVRTRSSYDGAIPSGNSRMIFNLLDLHEITGDQSWFDRALRDMNSFSSLLSRRGHGMVHMVDALLAAIEMHPDHFVEHQPEEVQLRTRPLSVEIDPPKVDVSSGSADFTVTLHIGDEYHLSAHRPGLEGLIPTTLDLQDAPGLSLDVDYPAGKSERYAFADEPINVYDGRVVLKATVRRGGREKVVAPKLILRCQICTDISCLEPRTHELPVKFVGLG